MKKLISGSCVLLLALMIVTPASAQRAVPSGGDAGRGADAGGSSAASAATYSSTSMTSSVSSVGYSARAYYNPVTPRPTIRLEGSCFSSVSEYNQWQNYYFYLNSRYNILPTYFSRFTRNYEPKMTPAMLKIALRDPLVLTREMLDAIDELESMLEGVRTGNTVDRHAIAAKSQSIRTLAKAIRRNQTIAIIDLSSKKSLHAGPDSDALDSETIARLREMALDLSRQLTDLYSLTSSSTISADSLKSPSFESQAKAIEKICRDIEHASKRL